MEVAIEVLEIPTVAISSNTQIVIIKMAEEEVLLAFQKNPLKNVLSTSFR